MKIVIFKSTNFEFESLSDKSNNLGFASSESSAQSDQSPLLPLIPKKVA